MAKPQLKTNRKPEVEVVSCPSSFPHSTIESKKRPHGVDNTKYKNFKDRQQSRQTPNSKKAKLLDWNETVKEIRGYGAQAFSGKLKRDYEEEQYYLFTGRHKKGQKVPLPIVRGIKKAAAKRRAKELQEARDAGIVLPKKITMMSKSSNKESSGSSTVRSYGPAPNIGFMKGGIYRVQDSDKTNSKRR